MQCFLISRGLDRCNTLWQLGQTVMKSSAPYFLLPSSSATGIARYMLNRLRQSRYISSVNLTYLTAPHGYKSCTVSCFDNAVDILTANHHGILVPQGHSLNRYLQKTFVPTNLIINEVYTLRWYSNSASISKNYF